MVAVGVNSKLEHERALHAARQKRWRAASKQRQEERQASCVHFWVIEPALAGRDGSPGVCQKCGVHRTFENSIPSHDWSGVRSE